MYEFVPTATGWRLYWGPPVDHEPKGTLPRQPGAPSQAAAAEGTPLLPFARVGTHALPPGMVPRGS
jgi:hypothetical protein